MIRELGNERLERRLLPPEFWKERRLHGSPTRGVMIWPRPPERYYMIYVWGPVFEKLFLLERLPEPLSTTAAELAPEQAPPPPPSPSKPALKHSPPKPKKKISAAEWLSEKFRPLGPREQQKDYLEGLYEAMQQDPTVRRVCKFHTLENCYSEFLWKR